MPKTQKSRSGARRGFTLIELLVVVVIIGILATIGAPGYSAAMDRARGAKVVGNVRVLQLAVESIASENRGAVPYTIYNYGQVTFDSSSGVYVDVKATLPKLPKSPWNPVAPPNSEVLGGDSSSPGGANFPDLDTAANRASNTLNASAYSKVGQKVEGHSSVPPGNYGPYNAQDCFGALAYGADTSSGVYVIYGLGKNRSWTEIVASVSNAGGSK